MYWAFPRWVTTRTPGTITEKFVIPGKKIPIIDLPGGDRVLVDIFTDIRSRCDTMRKNLDGFVEIPSLKPQENQIQSIKLEGYHPLFARLITMYKQMAGSNFRKGGTSSKENYEVKIKQMPPGVKYFICHFPDEKKFTIELNIYKSRAPQFESIIRNLYSDNRFVGLPKPELWGQEIKEGILFR